MELNDREGSTDSAEQHSFSGLRTFKACLVPIGFGWNKRSWNGDSKTVIKKTSRKNMARGIVEADNGALKSLGVRNQHKRSARLQTRWKRRSDTTIAHNAYRKQQKGANTRNDIFLY